MLVRLLAIFGVSSILNERLLVEALFDKLLPYLSNCEHYTSVPHHTMGTNVLGNRLGILRWPRIMQSTFSETKFVANKI